MGAADLGRKRRLGWVPSPNVKVLLSSANVNTSAVCAQVYKIRISKLEFQYKLSFPMRSHPGVAECVDTIDVPSMLVVCTVAVVLERSLLPV